MKGFLANFEQAMLDWQGRNALRSVDSRLALYEKMLAFVDDGIAIQDAIARLLKRQVAAKKPLQYALRNWDYRLRGGARLADAMEGWVPNQDIALINAGERGGQMADALREMTRIQSELLALRKATLPKMITSGVFFTILFGIIYGMSSFLIPQFKDIMDESEYPTFTAFFFMFTDGVAAWGLPVAGTIVAVAILMAISMPRVTGGIRAHLNRIPPWSLYRRMQASVLLVVVSGMLKAGIPIENTLVSITRFSNPFLKEHLKHMVHGLRKGYPEARAMDTGLFPDDMAQDILDYAELTSFDAGILAVSNRATEKTKKTLVGFAGFLETIVKLSIMAFALSTMVGLLMMVQEVYNAAG